MSETCSILDVPITAQEYDKLSNIQQQVLALVASDEPATKILNSLCSLAETLLPNSVASVMLLDDSTQLLSVLVAPSVPQEGHDALANLQPGPHGGSCGNAVFNNEPQFVQNTFEDSRWQNLRQVAYDFNLCACWSMPIRDQHNNAIGSFALSSFEHRTPAPFHQKLLETAAAIVAIVLKKQQTDKRMQLFATAIQNTSEGMVITDNNNNIIEVNSTFEKIYGYTEAEVIGKNPNILSSGSHNNFYYKKMWAELNNHDKWSGEITNKHKDGSKITQWMSVSVIRDENQRLTQYLSIFSDLTELKKAQQQIIDMAYHDSITHLFNKSALEKRLREQPKSFTLILLNINNFSYINTAYGFDTGDQLLIKVADELVENFSAHSSYRFNSDEYALLFNIGIDIEQQVIDIQQHFYNTLIRIDNISLNISFTYGAATGNKKLLRSGALALKQAKELGRNRYHIFERGSESIDHAQRESFIEANSLLHSAIEENRVIPYFQGIHNNKTGEIAKYEVLVRIKDNGQIISPFKFLEPARLSGLLPEITKIMIDKSFAIMVNNNHSFSINITEDDLNKNYLIDFLSNKLSQHNIDPKRIILEILEGVSSTGKKSNTNQLNQLKKLGLSLAIDDFGTEYSNFERILDLDIDFLKIDAKYIKDIDVNPKSYEITRAIAFFAKNANIPCIAEFVHSEAVQKIVLDLGIDYSQGYYFSEPAPFKN